MGWVGPRANGSTCSSADHADPRHGSGSRPSGRQRSVPTLAGLRTTRIHFRITRQDPTWGPPDAFGGRSTDSLTASGDCPSRANGGGGAVSSH